jgi:hypothetical protein
MEDSFYKLKSLADYPLADCPIQLAKIDPNDSCKFVWDRELIKKIFFDKSVASLPVRDTFTIFMILVTIKCFRWPLFQ